MKGILSFVFFTFSICITFSQEITIRSLIDNKSEVRISNGEIVKISFGDYFRAEGETFNLVDYYVYSDSLSHNRIGKYGKNRLKIDGNKRYKYKLDRKSERVFVYDKDKNVVFEGRLVYNNNFGYLKSIELVSNQTDSGVIEAWVALSTIQRMYGGESKELIDNIIFGVLLGLGISIGGGI